MTRTDPWHAPACAACGLALAAMYDFAFGGERSQVVCFDCNPPRVMCPACAREHRCRAPRRAEGH